MPPRLPAHNLPIPLSSFIGRVRELGEVQRLLASSRLLTLTGVAGGGKTRLALQAAGELADRFPDGVWLVELAGVADPALLPQTLAAALGLSEQAGRPLAETLLDFLKLRSLLLIVDNCEHLVAACASLVERLLRNCAGLRVLATSREPLGVLGETVWQVPPLSLAGQPTLDEESEAVRLFVERARACRPGFALTAGNAPTIAQLCRRLDGLPLAIELAAARVTALPVEQIAARLDDRLRLLVDGSRTALPRQQTLRATLDWSYDLLSEAEQKLFERLSVFSGGFTLEAAEAVCAGGSVEGAELLNLLARLVAKSLVVMDARGGEARYRLLETLREYALGKLSAGAEPERCATAGGFEEAVRRRHATWFLALAEEGGLQLKGPQQLTWEARLEADHHNLRAALGWAIDRQEVDTALRLGAALWNFWYHRGHLVEGRARYTTLLALPVTLEQRALRARVLNGAAYLARQQGDYAAARSLSEESLALFRELGDWAGIAFAAQAAGFAAQVQEDYSTARALLEESLALSREIGDTFVMALALYHLGVISCDAGEDFETAQLLLEQSLTLYRDLDNPRQSAIALVALGAVARARGERVKARAYLSEALATLGEVGDRWWSALAFDRLAALDADAARPERALRLAGAADQLHATLGTRRWPVLQRERHRWLQPLRRAVGDRRFAAALAAGAAQPLEEALTEALHDTGDTDGGQPVGSGKAGSAWLPAPAGDRTSRRPARGRFPDGLTAREVEVLALIAAGRSNKEIAAELMLSIRTVGRHITNIYTKIGARGKADATAYALRHGIEAVGIRQ